MDTLIDQFNILSTAFICKNDFNKGFVKEKFESVINSNLEDVNIPLYRGVSIKEVLGNPFKVGNVITLDRITSFTEDKKIAESFSSDEYGTHVVYKLSSGKAFNYTKLTADIIEEMCDRSINQEEIAYLSDQRDMVIEEKEWMVSSNNSYKIENIEYRSRYDQSKEFTIIELTVI